MASKSLDIKIAQQKAAATSFVPQTRLCSAVVMLAASGQDMASAIAVLKTKMGTNWSPVTAFQFLSGSQAKYAAECCDGVEREILLQAHAYAVQMVESSITDKMSLSAMIKLTHRKSV